MAFGMAEKAKLYANKYRVFLYILYLIANSEVPTNQKCISNMGKCAGQDYLLSISSLVSRNLKTTVC